MNLEYVGGLVFVAVDRLEHFADQAFFAFRKAHDRRFDAGIRTDTDLFAAVNECVDVKCLGRRGVVMHRGPAGFVPLGTFPTTEPVHALVARGNSEVIVSAEG